MEKNKSELIKQYLEQAPKIKKMRGEKILVRMTPEDADTKTVGGIIIPSVQKEIRARRGVVVRVGSRIEKFNEEFPDESIEIGEEIAMSQFAGSEIEYLGVDYRVLNPTDIHFTYE